MKLKTILSLFGCLSIITPVLAQTTADALKAIDAEQYQKAKAQLQQLIITTPAKDENYFHLGWVYVLQDYPDSAKAVFSKGIAADPKSALNYVGLGIVAKLDKDDISMLTNFEKATTLAGKDDKPYVYIAQAYLLKPDPKVDLALNTLTKAAKSGAKDPEYFLTMGDIYHAKLDNNNAYSNYSQAQLLDPKSARTNVVIGSLWKQANNFDDATQKFKDALAINPNYGPAYRELAETDLRWALTDPKMASVKVKEGADYYKKYLDLTDRSAESEMRYADFLIQAGDYTALEQVANDLAKSSKSNLRIYRYLGYAGYENKNYQAGLDALQKFVKEADAKRIIPRDYLYLGRLQLKTNQDSLGILNLNKAIALDSTFEEAYNDIAGSLYAKKKYVEAGDAYKKYIEHSHHVKLTEYFREGMSYYYGYSNQYYNSADNKGGTKPDSSLLAKADSAFSYIQQKTVAKPVGDVLLYRARIKDLEEKDRNNIEGLAKPLYEQYITLETVTPPTDERTKKNLGEAYAYLGSYYAYKEKDDNKATENFKKASEIYPDNKQAKAYLAKKEASDSKSK
ncbi:Tetratricopeptide repeat-containing protein [Mucilaginibacter sp. OK268]|uniref:tetratricopeptide repeat protein n=1 Tax=Mucilaginibacter sp. OK268 TaxID=1881048 RepID=UPI00088186F0|nr:tetratricopeptide repeat protein [Mucilaginibacter sp. OK268]SDP09631.1 Tetratricopeptide repeat-containing protein [Mucilaginibacter sp. OK268]